MNRLRDIEIEWILRKFRALRVDPAVAHLWAGSLAVIIGLVITFVVVFLVIRKIGSFIFITVFESVDAHNSMVTESRVETVIVGVLLAATLAFGTWWYRRRARQIAVTHPFDSVLCKWASWLCLAGILAVAAGVVLCWAYGPQYHHL